MKNLLLLLLATIFFSCATIKTGDLYNLETKGVSFDASSIEININDPRSIKNANQNIKIPAISFPGDQLMHHRRFSNSELKKIFRNELLLKSEKGTGIIDVKILKSIQYFSTDDPKEVEEVVAKVHVKKTIGVNSCEGVREVRGRVESIDASVEYINKMLKDALGKSFNLALLSCK